MTVDEHAILELERERCVALTSGDINALSKLLGEGLLHIHGSGQVENRAEYLKGVETKFIFHRIDRDDLQVKVHGDCAIVVGPLEQVVQVRGDDKRHEISAVVSQTWVRCENKWKQNCCHMHFLSVA